MCATNALLHEPAHLVGSGKELFFRSSSAAPSWRWFTSSLFSLINLIDRFSAQIDCDAGRQKVWQFEFEIFFANQHPKFLPTHRKTYILSERDDPLSLSFEDEPPHARDRVF